MESRRLLFLSVVGLILLLPSRVSAQGVISHMSPNVATPAGRSFTLIVNGIWFTPNSVIHWNGNPCPTTYVRADKLTAAIPGEYVRRIGSATVTVVDPEAGASNERNFSIVHGPIATITALQPEPAEAGGKAFRLTVFGTGFKPGSVVYWNGYSRPTAFFNDTDVDAAISEADIAVSGAADVCVVDRATGLATESVTYKIRSALSPPVITAISPKSVAAGGTSFKLTVSGSDFTSTTVVQWGGESLPTTFIDDSTLAADVLESRIGEPGSVSVTVLENAKGGGLSNSATFVVEAPIVLPTDLFFPYIAVGAGNTTSLTLMNWGAEPATAKVNLVGQDGTPMDVTVSEQRLADAITGSTFTTSLEAGTTKVFTISSPGSQDAAETGWARIQMSEGMVQGTLTYRLRKEGTLHGISAASPVKPTNYLVAPVDNNVDEGRFTGLTLANPSEEELNLLLITLDEDGAFLEFTNPPEINPLPPHGQARIFLHDILPERANHHGSVLVIDELSRSFLGAVIVVEGGLTYIEPAQ